MKKSTFKITADREEYTVGLTGDLYIDGFSGFGEGWFNIRDVITFSEDLMTLATNMEGKVELLGTQRKADGRKSLERFCLRCYVLDNSIINGVIGVHITLSEYPYTDCREQEILKVSGEMKVRNHHLLEFSEDLRKLLSGDAGEVCLNGDLSKR